MSKPNEMCIINVGPDTIADTLGTKNRTSEHFWHPPYFPLMRLAGADPVTHGMTGAGYTGHGTHAHV